MKKFAASVGILAVALLVHASGQTFLQRENPQPASGTIEGDVTVEGKSAPGIKIFLIRADDSFRSSAINAQGISDEQGRFRITGVPEGAYTVVTEAGPYVLANKGYRGTAGVLVLVKPGEENSGVELELHQGGTITGRVTDAEGQPIIGGRVSIQRMSEPDVQLAITQPGITRPPPIPPTREFARSNQIVPLSNQLPDTDDRGIYRIYGLPAGKYIVSVKPNSVPLPPGISGDSLDSSTTYYPGVTDESKAAPVDLKTGGNVEAVDIVVSPPLETHSVAGRIVDSASGQPVPNVRVSYTKPVQITIEPPNLTQVLTDASGEFRLNGLTTGQYVLLTLPDTGSDLYSNPTPIQIINDDLNGVEIQLMKGASLSGNAVLSDSGDDSNVPANITVSAVLQGDGTFAERMLARSTIDSNGNFRLLGLRPGHIQLMINSYPANDISLLSIDRNGMDVSGGIDVGAGESISGVRVVLGNGQGNIAGSLKTKNGESFEGARLSVSLKGLKTNLPQRFAEVDKSGRFTVVNLPTGDYELNAFMALPAASGKRPALLTAKQNITVKAKRTTEITVVLDAPQH